VRIQFLLPKERFSAPESRIARITIRNEGLQPVEFLDPIRNADQSLTVTLTGPEYPEGRSVTRRSAYLSNPAYFLPPDDAPRVRLGAGQAIESTVHLHEWFPTRSPGRYRLQARLTNESLDVVSAPVDFDIVPSSATSLSLGFDLPTRWTDSVSATWLQQMDDSLLLMGGGYSDESGDCEGSGGVPNGNAFVLGPVEPGSTDALYPWSNDFYGNASVRWLVWRKGSTLMALAEPATTTNPFHFDLGAPPERVIRPPLQTAAGELFIPVVAAGGRDVRLIRFQSSSDATEITPGREVGRVRIPGTPVAARATIQPASVGNGISLLLVEESAGGLDLHHVRSSSTGRLTRVASTLLRGLRALPQSEPGLWIDEAGRLNAVLVAASLKNPRQALLAQVRYRPDGRLEAPARVTSLGMLPGAPRAAAARHPPEPQGDRGMQWAILLEDGRLLHQDTREGPMRPRFPAAVPLELYPAGYTYVLTVDPAMGPTFEPLR
jgi:hypothetical protein